MREIRFITFYDNSWYVEIVCIKYSVIFPLHDELQNTTGPYFVLNKKERLFDNPFLKKKIKNKIPRFNKHLTSV